jgi:MFS family permease
MPLQWVRIIEHFPHRPILIWGLFISGVIAIVFGLSTKFYHVVALRAVLGAAECLGLMANIMVGQLVDKTSRAQGSSFQVLNGSLIDATGFSWTGSANFAGVASGIFLGGLLASPAGRIPVLGNMSLFHTKPFLLPGLTLGIT